jgi:hypothetical protein
LQGGDDPFQGALFLVALFEPDVVVAHLLAGLGAEGLLSAVDEVDEPVELVFVVGEVGGVGGELVAGQAGGSTPAAARRARPA